MSNLIDRRKFLKTGCSAAAGYSLYGSNTYGKSKSFKPVNSKSSPDTEMKYRRLGRTGFMASEIAFGCSVVSPKNYQFVEMAKKQLETRKPKFVVINLYNNLGVAHYGKLRGDISRYFCLPNEKGPVFAGEGNKLEKFILENYKTVLKNDLAVVMGQRVKPIEIKEKKKMIYSWQPGKEKDMQLQSMEKTNRSDQYTIIGKNASWTLILEKPIEALDIEVELRLDDNFLTKHLTRYYLNLYALTGEINKESGIVRILATKAWQTVKIPLPKPQKIEIVKIQIANNTGLIWWLNPNTLEVKQIKFFSHGE